MTKKGNKTNIFSEWQENWSGWGSTSLLGRVGGVSFPQAFEPHSPINDFLILASERVSHFEVSVRGQILTRKRKKLNHRFIGVWFKPITKVLRCINRFSGFLEKLYPGIIRYFMVYCLSRVLVYLSINSLVEQWGSY